MHKHWNIISRDFPGLERNPGIKIPVKMTRDPGNPGSWDPGTEPQDCTLLLKQCYADRIDLDQ